MPKERIIPTIEAAAEFKIFVNENEVPRSVVKIGVHILKVVNKISAATIVLQDGSPTDEDFPLSSGNLFLPGNAITIAAGDADSTRNIFTGIIIKQSLKIRSSRVSQLILECRHAVIKTTIGRKSACFHKKTDAEVFKQILQQYGFTCDIESSSFSHDALVQYNCTNWDFILNRAEMVGKVILTNDESIIIKSPAVENNAALSLLSGDTIIELDAEMDSRNQYKAVKAQAWDMADQAIAESQASEPAALQEQGNFSTTDLAKAMGLEEFSLNYAGTLTPDERQAWADAQLLKSRLSKIRGRAKLRGISTINPGDVVELNGLGDRFNGNGFISGVRHDYDTLNGWKTQVQFGHSPEWFAEENEINANKAGGLLPGVTGLHTGIVTDNEDPQGEMRVRVKFPYINPDDDGVWARIALTDAGNERGMFFRPEIGDEVVTGFLYDDPRQPVILGMLHSSALPAPLQPSNDNNQKGYTSREKMVWQFDDDKMEFKIETPAGNKIIVSEDQKSITIQDQNNNKILLNEDGVTINDDSEGEIITLAKNTGQLKIKANAKVIVEAPQIELVEGAAHPLVFGDNLLTYLNQVVQIFNTHMHPGELALGSLPVTPAPPAPPLPTPTPALLSVKVKTG